jgi:hypothetical protein
VSKAFLECKLAEGATVGPHVIKMVGYSQRLEKLGYSISQELATDFILASLLPSYGNFITNYHMHGAENGLNGLYGMLKTIERDAKKSTGNNGHVMAVQNKPNFKKKGKSQKKKGEAKDTVSMPNQRLDQLQIQRAFTAKNLVTRRGIANITWPILRIATVRVQP